MIVTQPDSPWKKPSGRSTVPATKHGWNQRPAKGCSGNEEPTRIPAGAKRLVRVGEEQERPIALGRAEGDAEHGTPVDGLGHHAVPRLLTA